MKRKLYITALKTLDASRRHREPVQGVTVKSCFRRTPRIFRRLSIALSA
jgi:hypothetical protein